MKLRIIYPAECQSAQCGAINCTGCKNERKLTEFRHIVEDAGATVTDKIWSPTVYEATISDAEADHFFNRLNAAGIHYGAA